MLVSPGAEEKRWGRYDVEHEATIANESGKGLRTGINLLNMQ